MARKSHGGFAVACHHGRWAVVPPGGTAHTLSETEFAWAAGNRLRFFKDASGRVTHFVITLVEGDLLVRRLPDARK